jgi:hypothetical protein
MTRKSRSRLQVQLWRPESSAPIHLVTQDNSADDANSQRSKRTMSGSRLGRSKTAKNKTPPPVAPLPQLPPSLDIDIRSSLILPGYDEPNAGK